jgi:hypothetical protein
MTKGKEGHPRGVALCGEYATKALEATVLERLRLLAQLRVALWRLRWTSRVASRLSLGADAYRVGPVGHDEMLAAKA